MSRIVLFDMDGTLTAPRQKIEKNIEEALISLSHLTKIGIVTGSNFDYVMQQCKSLFQRNEDFSNFFILPFRGEKIQETHFHFIRKNVYGADDKPIQVSCNWSFYFF